MSALLLFWNSPYQPGNCSNSTALSEFSDTNYFKCGLTFDGSYLCKNFLQNLRIDIVKLH